MKKITKEIFVAEDGAEFLNATDCKAHEDELHDTEEVRKAWETIHNYCMDYCNADEEHDEPVCKNTKCPFYLPDLYNYNCAFGCYPYSDIDIET